MVQTQHPSTPRSALQRIACSMCCIRGYPAKDVSCEDGDECWICLDASVSNPENPIISPCRCPRVCHKNCLARWQLESNERNCRFCGEDQSRWKMKSPKKYTIFIAYKQRTYKLTINPNTYNEANFVRQIKMLLGIPMESAVQVHVYLNDFFNNTKFCTYGADRIDNMIHYALFTPKKPTMLKRLVRFICPCK